MEKEARGGGQKEKEEIGLPTLFFAAVRLRDGTRRTAQFLFWISDFL